MSHLADLFDRLAELEGDVRYREPPKEGEREIGCAGGGVPVLLSAPHSAVHTRGGKPKEEEEFTAALACLVADLTDSHALYARRKLPTDPNWERAVDYKRCVRRLVAEEGVEFVLDIHGMAPHRDLGIALGTMNGESCLEKRETIVRLFESHGFGQKRDSLDRLDVDQTFTARGLGGQETVTSFAWRVLGVPSAQLELHPALRVVERREDASLPRPYQGDAGRIRRVVQALVDIVGAVSSEDSRDV